MKRSLSVKAALSDARKSPKYWSAMSAFQFGEGLRRLMIEEGMKQKDLADRLGKSSAWVSKVLNGTANLTLNKMSEIAVQLGAAVHIHVASQDQYVDWSEISKDQEAGVSVFDANLEAMATWASILDNLQTVLSSLELSSLDAFDMDLVPVVQPSVHQATTGGMFYVREESEATTEGRWIN